MHYTSEEETKIKAFSLLITSCANFELEVSLIAEENYFFPKIVSSSALLVSTTSMYRYEPTI